jgi:hypothetical protein
MYLEADSGNSKLKFSIIAHEKPDKNSKKTQKNNVNNGFIICFNK